MIATQKRKEIKALKDRLILIQKQIIDVTGGHGWYAFPDCPICQLRDQYEPTHLGSKDCVSGSIASGGTKEHCNCRVCFVNRRPGLGCGRSTFILDEETQQMMRMICGRNNGFCPDCSPEIAQ